MNSVGRVISGLILINQEQVGLGVYQIILLLWEMLDNTFLLLIYTRANTDKNDKPFLGNIIKVG